MFPRPGGPTSARFPVRSATAGAKSRSARVPVASGLRRSGHGARSRTRFEAAVSIHHTLTLAHVLSDAACPVALMIGDLELAERYTAMLHEQTKDPFSRRMEHLCRWLSREEILIRRG